MTLQQLAQKVRDLSKEPLKVDPSQPQVTVKGEPIRSYLSKLADRIDELASSAYNRIDSWKEICAKCKDGDIDPKHCEYYGEPNGCNSPTYGEHPPALNMMAMRQAMEDYYE